MSDRRGFLKGAAVLSGAAGLDAIMAQMARAMAIPAHVRRGSVQDIEHIVVFMQENRSFDHYFGLLDGVRGFGDPRPLRSRPGGVVWRQSSSQHADGWVLPFYGDSRVTNALVIEGSGQNHHDNLTLLNEGRYDLWGATGELHKRMAHYSGRDLQYYYALASSFTVCDAYHCSTLTQTYPNRLHLWTGCNGGGGVGGDPVMSNYGEDQTPTSDMSTDKPIPGGPLTWTTYAERLEVAGVSWKVYQEYDNFQDNILSVFAPFRPADRSSSLYARGRSWVSEHDPNPDNVRKSTGELLVQAFRQDVASGNLPQVSWIVTAEDLSEHPAAAPAQGEDICARLIDVLIDHPETFSKTVFIVNYDEAGGFFDHMPPPTPPVEPGDGFSTVSVEGEVKAYAVGEPNPGRHPIGLGVRTPAIIVSPWSRGGFVCSQVFDHTSVIRLMEARFGVVEPNISPWRRAVCGDLTACLDFAAPNRDWAVLVLPSTRDHLARVARARAAPGLDIPRRQAPTSQAAVRRPSRALGYDLHVDARVVEGRLRLGLVNDGTLGAVFQVHDAAGVEGPWTFTLGAGDRHEASPWRADAPDLTIHGPDGFHREVRDLAASAVTVVVRCEAPSSIGRVTLANPGARAVDAVVRLADAYRAGQPARRSVAVPPHGVLQERFSLAQGGWYDLTVTLRPHSGAHAHHRFAGRFHDGRPGLTDPGIGEMVLT